MGGQEEGTAKVVLPRIEEVLEYTTDCVALLDHDWRFTFLNRNAIASIGRGRDLIGVPLHEVFRLEQGTAEWKKTQHAARARESVSFEFFASHLAAWFEVHVHPLPSGLQIFFRDVTSRREAERSIAESEETLRLALEAAGDAAWDWDLQAQRITMSGDMVGKLGYGDASYGGSIGSFVQIIHREDAARVRRALTDHLAGRSSAYRCEYRLRSSDGAWRWNLDRGRVVARDPATGRATRIVGTSSDITERKIAEEQSRDQANLLSLAQHGAGAAAWEMDLKTFITKLSPGAVEMLGLPKEHSGEVLPTDWLDFVEPADLRVAQAQLGAALSARTNFSVEYRVKTKDGGVRWVQGMGNVATDSSGEPNRLIGLILDITDRMTAADALRESEERLRLSLEAAGDGAWDWHLPTGRITRSPRLVRRLGYEPQGFRGTITDLVPLIHPDDVGEVNRRLEDHLSGRATSFAVEYRVRSAKGEWVWIADRGRIVERDLITGKATRMVGTGSDITARKRAELELHRVQAELIHLSRLSAMGAMASTLAHELNQPLIAIANFVRAIRHLSDLAEKELLPDALDGLEGAAQRAGAIVRRLRDYVTRGEIDRRPESIEEILREACALALVDAPMLGIDHSVEVPEGLPKVLVDRIQVQQVLHNLIRNGVEAMKDMPGQRRIHISARANGARTLEIRVADSGPGIAEAVGDQLFTPFVSTKAGGMGVGLSISRTIIEAHEGRIWAQAVPDGGTEFRFTLETVEP